MTNSTIVNACMLREKENLNKISATNPGYYKWWADKKSLEIILSKLSIKFEDIQESLEVKNDNLYCIYVGVAIKESIKARLNWHINQINTPVSVKYGTLSTLRQTISSIVGENMLDTNSTNDFIDKLTIEYFLSDNPINSIEAKTEIHLIEQELLNSKYLYILNIQSNKHHLAPINKLKLLRKNAKLACNLD